MAGNQEPDTWAGNGTRGRSGGRGTLIAAIGTAALAGLLFGFDTAVIAGVTGDLTSLFTLTPETLGITVSAALWGTLVGALFAGKPGDAFGSRDSLRVLAAFYFVAGLGCALASNWPAFLGKSGEAIRHFEILVEQQSRSATRPEFSQTYLILGNMYLDTGKHEQALQVWRDGLALFPDDEELRRQIDYNAR